MTTAAPEPHDAGGCSDDAWRVLLLINDWIKHADAKTAGTLAAAGVSAGVLYSVVSDVHVLALPTTGCVAAAAGGPSGAVHASAAPLLRVLRTGVWSGCCAAERCAARCASSTPRRLATAPDARAQRSTCATSLS